MRLAAGVAHTVDWREMLDQIDEEDFRDWQAFDSQICPIGPERLDAAIAGFMAAVVRYLGSLAGEKSEVLQEITPKSFCPWLNDEPEKEATEAMEAEAMRVNMESAVLKAQAHIRQSV
ncbi:MAG TPA: hypothetical protein VNQ76_14155 [Planctomicrobium sp.]|nr:hypothetical protein [Planctomicrobium sp.]